MLSIKRVRVSWLSSANNPMRTTIKLFTLYELNPVVYDAMVNSRAIRFSCSIACDRALNYGAFRVNLKSISGIPVSSSSAASKLSSPWARKSTSFACVWT